MPDETAPFFVLDLDDTLYPERSYVRSALFWVGADLAKTFDVEDLGPELWSRYRNGAANPLLDTWLEHGLPQDLMAAHVAAMRAHKPAITLFPDAARLLDKVRARGSGFAIVTDGRSATQRAKLAALGLDDADHVSISEEVGLVKTDVARFLPILALVGQRPCICIGDNPAKDFVVAKSLGWNTVMRRHDGSGVHSQVMPTELRYHPARTILSLDYL